MGGKLVQDKHAMAAQDLGDVGESGPVILYQQDGDILWFKATKQVARPYIHLGCKDYVTFSQAACEALGLKAATGLRFGRDRKQRIVIRVAQVTDDPSTVFSARKQKSHPFRIRSVHLMAALVANGCQVGHRYWLTGAGGHLIIDVGSGRPCGAAQKSAKDAA